jgi:hypothetical protein
MFELFLGRARTLESTTKGRAPTNELDEKIMSKVSVLSLTPTKPHGGSET